MPHVTVYVTEMETTDQVVVMAPAKAPATSALLITLREQFGDHVRIVRINGRARARGQARPR